MPVEPLKSLRPLDDHQMLEKIAEKQSKQSWIAPQLFDPDQLRYDLSNRMPETASLVNHDVDCDPSYRPYEMKPWTTTSAGPSIATIAWPMCLGWLSPLHGWPYFFSWTKF